MSEEKEQVPAELLPCPFCGATVEQLEYDWRCQHSPNCILSYFAPIQYLRRADFKSWNKRAALEPLKAQQKDAPNAARELGYLK